MISKIFLEQISKSFKVGLFELFPYHEVNHTLEKFKQYSYRNLLNIEGLANNLMWL